MQKLVWQNANGDSIDLTSGNYGITQWEGFSNASLNIQSQQVPFQDGGVYLDSLINQRELSVTLKMQDNGNLEERYRMRRELIHILNPKLGEGYLIYTNDFISKRIKCVAQVPLFETHNSDTRGTPKASLSWTACEPYWEDLKESEILIKDSELVVVENKGDYDCSIKLDLYGRNVNPTIINQNTHRFLTINGSYDNPIRIDTNYGSKHISLCELNFNWYSGSRFLCCYTDKYKTFFAGSLLCCKNYLSDDFENIKISTSEIKKILKVGNNRYILLSTYTTLKSDDGGSTWSILGSYSRTFNDMIYNDGLCVAVSGANYIYTSENNGDTWVGHSTGHSGYNFYMNTVCYCDGFYLAFGNRSNVMKSIDGFDWQDMRNSLSASTLNHSAYGNGIIIVAGTNSNIIGKSNDGGSTWTQFNIGFAINCVIYDSETKSFLFVGSNKICALREIDNYSNYEEIYSEPMGETLFGICCYKNSYYAVGTNVLLQSQNSVNWDYFVESSFSFSDVLNYNNILIGLSGYDVVKSLNGIHWEKICTLGGNQGKKIIHSKKYYFILGIREIYRSEDGVDYPILYSTNEELQSIAYGEISGEKIIVVVGNNGTIIMSDDEGDTWSSINSGVSGQITDVIFANDNIIASAFYATSITGETLKSINGYTWENISNGSVHYIKKFIYVNGFFSGFGEDIHGNQCITKSNDCIHWETIQVNNIFDFIKNVNNQIFIGGDSLISSYDGVNWKNYELNNMNLKGVFIIKDLYVTYGLYGVIFHSKLIEVLNIINKLTTDSDIGLKLTVGENKITYKTDGDNSYLILKYRQKYIGV